MLSKASPIMDAWGRTKENFFPRPKAEFIFVFCFRFGE